MKQKLKFETSKVTILNSTQAEELMGVKPSATLAVFKMTMLHSLPYVNSNGRAFSYAVLKKSVGSIPHNLVDLEHIMKDLGGDKEEIIGHIVSCELPEDKSDGSSVALDIVGVLYKRRQEVKDILSHTEAGEKEWKGSMECLYDPDESALWYDAGFVSVGDASEEMMACVGGSSVKDFQGKPMAYALGGKEGEVYFSGIGFTLTPADKEAKLKSLVASVAKDGMMVLAGKEKFKCECIECGKKVTSEEHCKNLKCSECGGQMRRVSRPGPGQKEKGGAKLNLEITSNGERAGTTIKLDGAEIDVEKLPYFNFSIFGPQDEDAVVGETPKKTKGSMSLTIEVKEEDEGAATTLTKRYELSNGELKENKSDKDTEKNKSKGGEKKMTDYAGILESLKGVFKGIEMDEAKAKVVSDTFEGILKSEVEKAVSEAKEGYKEHKAPDDVTAAIAEAIKDAKEKWELEKAKIAEREKKFEDEKIELTDYRKSELAKFALDEEGDKQFVAWFEDLKVDRKKPEVATAKGGGNFNPGRGGSADSGMKGAH